MPEIARLGSIIIRVYADDARRHHQPHFDAVGPDEAMIDALPSLAIIAGRLRRSSDVLAWAKVPENLDKLIRAWNYSNPDHQITAEPQR